MSGTFSTIAPSSADGVLTITLNRPESLNAFNEQMSIELAAVLKTAAREDSVRCVVLTGAGKGFCSGQDLAEIKDRYTDPTISQDIDFATLLRQKYNPLVTRLRTLEKPIVAAINGVAAGAGAAFAFACDLRICARSAAFAMAFTSIGLVPDSAACLTLMQHVGYARAAEMLLLGEKIPAEQALAWGLVNRVVDDAELPAKTAELAAKLARMPTRALGLTKRLLNSAWNTTLEQQLESEAFLQFTAGNTADHREGVRAFLEKRKPNFAGR
ncbi:MAG: enoyl-CoA hydratase/isomerase family protein [Planctomycetes bacterium]|nr:enoyl-CoA hydratase/isomerase family protein [Planctomycetota bacterium]